MGGVTAVRLPVAGSSVAALQAGTDGPRVLLLPGFTGSKEDFRPVLAGLGAAGLRVTAVDLPGQFESAGPAEPGAYSPDAMAAVVHALIDTLDGPVHLLGHSYGGLIARAAMIADTRSRISSLVLMASGPAAIGGRRRQLVDYLEPMLADNDLEALYLAVVAATELVPGYLEPTPAEADFLQRRFLAGAPAMLRGMGDAIRAEPDRVDELAAAAAHRPILVLYGADDDAWTPTEQAEMARRLGAQEQIIEGAMHSPAEQNPAATLAALVRFWHSLG